MKKSYKCLILVGAATLAIGTSMIPLNNPINKENMQREIQAYNHKPSNALENIFIENQDIILPFIFEDATKTISVDTIKEEFKKAGLTVKEISTGTTIGTGTKITVKENANVYTVLIYGDVNGDGKVNLRDAQRIVLHQKEPDTRALTGIYFKAGNVANNDEKLNLRDAQRVVLFQKGEQEKVVVVEPQSAKELDKEKPVITVDNTNVYTMQVGGSKPTFKATVTDNYDKNVKVVITDNINTSRVGSYTVTFTATDMSGNKAIVTKEFKVVDTIKPVITVDNTNIYTMEVGGSKPTFKATVTDNYDKDIKVVITDNINTSRVGKYTVTFTATDSSNNTTVITKEFEVTDKIASIEMATQPAKVEYDYGVTKLDLTNAQIKINWESGKASTNKAITEDMLVKDYDLTVAGSKKITVEYNGKRTSFDILVRGKINDLDLTEEVTQNIESITGGYKVASKQDFTLGNIQAVQYDNVSILQESQIKVETISVQDSNAGATVNDLTISLAIENGKIVLKGNAQKEGTYNIKVSMKENANIALNLTIKAEASTQVGEISLEAIEAGKIKYNIAETVKKELTIKNINGEEIELFAENITITDCPQNVTVVKLDADKNPIENNEDTTVVKYLEITTSLKTRQTVSFKLGVKDTTISETITFEIGDESVLNNVRFGEREVQLYTEQTQGAILNEGNIYTVVPIEFYNQDGEIMNVMAKNMRIVEEGDDSAMTDQEVRLITPLVKKVITANGISFELQGNAIDIIYFDKDGNKVEPGIENNIKKIGISILLTDANSKVVLSDLTGKMLQVTCKKQAKADELIMKASYKAITTAKLDTTGVTLPSKTTEGYYSIGLNQEVVFGKIEVGDYEGPLTPEMLRAELTAGTENKVKVSFEYEDAINKTGSILLKVEALESTICEIIPYVGDIEVDLEDSIIVKAQGVPTIQKVEIKNKNVEIGKATITEIKAISASKPNGEILKLKDITIPEVEGLTIQPLDEFKDPIAKTHLEEEVYYLEISTDTITQDTSKDVEFTIFGKNYTETIQVYNPIPRVITMEPTVNLYEAETADTVTVDGNIYTLVKIEVFADAAKTKPVTLTKNMLTDTSEAGKILVEIPQTSIMMDSIQMEIPQELVELQYFDKDKKTATSNIEYVGFAIRQLSGYTYDKTLLNGLKISFTCVDTSDVLEVTTQYK